MEKSFDDYILKVKSQLVCNADDFQKANHYLYDYTDNQIDENLNYFKGCYREGLSEYKSLLFFHDYLNKQ
jgi:hypothetical protein